MTNEERNEEVDLTKIKMFDYVIRNMTLLSNADHSYRVKKMSFPPKFNLTVEPITNISTTQKDLRLGLRFVIETDVEEGRSVDSLEVFIYFFFHFEGDLESHIESVNPKTKEIRLKAGLWLALAEASYSTARGVLLQKTTGTVFEPLILPLFDISNLIAPEYR